MKNQPCQCAKKKKRKTIQPIKKVSVPASSYNKFAGVRAPILANTGGTFTMPGFAPIKAFPYPGLQVGNASQMYGLLSGSNLADLAAANIYRAQDKRDDVASGIGITGLAPASKGNASGHSINMTSPNRPIISPTPPPIPPRTPLKIKQEEINQANQMGLRAAQFTAFNADLGDQINPFNLTQDAAPVSTKSAGVSTRSQTQIAKTTKTQIPVSGAAKR